MEGLPDLVLLKIAEYLSPAECVRLSLTCKRFLGLLPQYVRFLGEDFKITGPHTGHWTPEFYFDGPDLKGKVKRFRASVEWKDQGWGNRKGQLIVKLMRRDSGQNMVIAEKTNIFGIAGHDWANSTCVFVTHPVVKLAEPGDFYRFERNAGGGGGHSLFARKFTVLLEFLSNKL
ncbi:LRR-GTPase of the ROCO family [Paramuricea clavata]|uniref:LRR-GTPase of the ROCO family n=1 Tax=Paramuricea clavata TaxID=317549 RepID=A0A6S7HQP9_PARCT|nr:LRR-GTPase of the ROCO family [Paramuricea clavata]